MSKLDKMTLGQKVKWLRKDAHITQRELAEKVGIHPNTINRLERDLITSEFFTMVCIADYFNVSLDWLAGRKGWTDGEI